MDPLSITASLIAVLQISGAVVSTCYEYRAKVKGASQDAARIVDEVNSIRDVLEKIFKLAENAEANSLPLSNFETLNKPDGPLLQCEAELILLQAKLKPAHGWKGIRNALVWPLKEGDVDRCLDRISRLKQTLQLALTVDQTSISIAIHEDMSRMRLSFETSKLVNQRQQICSWLAAPNPSSNQNDAQSRRAPNTGKWCIESPQFIKWKTTPGSILWLHGIPGCGKTVLCSTTIKEVSNMCRSDPTCAFAYFFFDFTEQKKQVYQNVVRSLVTQLARQSAEIPQSLLSLYSQCQEWDQQPNLQDLLSVLRLMIEETRHTYIIIDALDECKDREKLLEMLHCIADWKIEKLHLLVTSRKEKDIEESLQQLVMEQICVQSILVDADIRTHISQVVPEDPKLKRWPPDVQAEIITTLIEGARGMFRWAVCQIDVLRKCTKLGQLRAALRSLPKTLDETYLRILSNIYSDYSRDAFKILQWLSFSYHPVTLNEISEMLAIDLDKIPRYDPDQRLQDPKDVLSICGSLISISDNDNVVRLSHYSVKEYLLSDRIRMGSQSRYHVSQIETDIFMAETCLAYFLEFDTWSYDIISELNDRPLIQYAVDFWYSHFDHIEKSARPARLIGLALQLLDETNRIFSKLTWMSVTSRRHGKSYSPLYYAAIIGSRDLIEIILDRGADVNAESGGCGNALQAASWRCNVNAVRVLLERGADVNLQGGFWGNSLQAAVCSECYGIVKLLIHQGANVNAFGGPYGTALCAAISFGSIDMTQLLLDAGAEVQPPESSEAECPLSKACQLRLEAVVKMLIERGADVNARNCEALQSALELSDIHIAGMLLNQGAEIHTRGGLHGSVLNAAAFSGHVPGLRLLLEKHQADPHWIDDQGRSALHVAASCDHPEAFLYLLHTGIDVAHKDKRGLSTIDHVASGASMLILQSILPYWQPEQLAENTWTPLHWACREGGPQIIDMLLKSGIKPTVVKTDEPPGLWTPYDIASFHQNRKLVMVDGTVVIGPLKAEDTASTITQMESAHVFDPTMYVCDCCERCIYGPVFHCRTCLDFDYCFMCKLTSDATHPHSSWELKVNDPLEVDEDSGSDLSSDCSFVGVDID